MTVLLLYVDDIILTCTSNTLLNHLVQYLSFVFAMKQLSDLHYFLGIKATRTHNGILLTRKKYTLELLNKAYMTEYNPCNTPVAKGPRVSINEGHLLQDVSTYRTIVDELEWLSSLMFELHISLNLPISLYFDNTSAIYLSVNHVCHCMTKHIKIQYHVVRELVSSGFLNVKHIASENQLADIFTKGSCAPVFTDLLQQLLGSPASTSASLCQSTYDNST
ncbi:uncharacterized protein LOC113316146 [Papaver somniferum]|uniref:uncharacterized protein LOC113316146 n=1 Tax=Papaver somniferum TaxID=3469 RepID=UPI000E6F901C|nr:uncharacterized protein LOC113316146 [Papaver somniferum]